MLNKALFSLLGGVTIVVCLSGVPIVQSAPVATAENTSLSEQIPKKIISNKRCLECHADEEEKTSERKDGTIVNIFIDRETLKNSVHGEQLCVNCHNSIRKAKHREPLPKSVGCVECHQQKQAETQGIEEPKHKRLDVIVEQIESYMRSIHARPNIKDQSRTNATCYNCHEAHNIGTIGSAVRAQHRQQNAYVCGHCHKQEKSDYLGSVHGHEVLDKNNTDAAVCSDCHTPHNINTMERDSGKLLITENCGNCHEEQLKTYRESYHGQVIRLGYTHTAKCYD